MRHRLRTIATLLALALVPSPRDVHAHAASGERIAWLTAQIESHPEQADLYRARGDLYRVIGDHARARADYLRARRLGPDTASVDLRLGLLALEEGRPGSALRLFEHTLRARPEDAAGYRLRARALQDLGRPLDAAADFRRAMAATTSEVVRPEDYLALAKALEAGGSRSEAIEALDDGMRHLGTLVSLQLPAVALDLDLGLVEEALGRLDTLRAGPGRPEVWLARRGEVLEAAGRAGEARQAYTAALRILDAERTRPHSRAMEDLEASLHEALRRLPPPESGGTEAH